jgi:8-oxo-dGTP diphosphatase
VPRREGLLMREAAHIIALAIITSRRGVFLGRRADRTPPWSFPGRKIEPGESAATAAVREVLEEPGLRVRSADVIGARIHPVTGVFIAYIAATLPVGRV